MSAVLYDVAGPRARQRQLVGTVIGLVAVVGLGLLVLWRLISQGVFDPEEFEPFTDPDILEGIGEGLLATIQAALAAIALALLLGAVLAVGRLSVRASLRVPVTLFVEFFRAVPLVLLILFLFLGFADTLGRFGALVIALTLYNGSVLAEVFRAGILAVPRGQSEAAYALGLRKSQVMRLVLVPQAVRTMLPAIISQCVVALKDTSLGFVIAYEELVRTGQLIYTSERNYIPTVLVVGGIYITMNFLLSRVAVWLEARQGRATAAPPEVVEAATDARTGG